MEEVRGRLREQIKQKLHSYNGAREECKQIDGQIAQIRTTMESPRIQAMDGMPRGSGGGDAMASIVAELIHLEEKYRDKLHRLHTAMSEVEDLIGSLDDPVERQVLRCRYIDGLIWEEVCVKLNYSWSQTHRIHGGALDKLVEAEIERQGIRFEPEVIGKVISVEVSPDGQGLTVTLEKEVGA
jgi:DNA-directed RNA polymerase specialized sigma subunit